MESKREIIYVDAGKVDENFRISMYHVEKHRTLIMDLVDIKDNNEAEIYAIYYAIFYINKYEYKNSIILSDNKTATQNNILNALARYLKVQISWIPREINQIADKNSKLEPTLDRYEFNTLRLFIDLSQKAYIQHDTLQEIEKLKKEKEKLSIKVKNQATQITNLTKK